MYHYPTTLFVSPKKGGILQSSGFLDLQSLSALSQTCKANMIDELSLIFLIENEITRYHGVKTMEEAIDFWKRVCRDHELKPWLERNSSTTEPITITRDMLSGATPYEVMLGKMLRTIPEQLPQLVNEHCEWTGRTVLHHAAYSGNPESLKTVLLLFPESERVRAVKVTDNDERTALHFAAESGSHESVRLILSLYPESERLQAVRTRDQAMPFHDVSMGRVVGGTVLHNAAQSGNFESIETVLDLYPGPERLQALTMTTHYGETVLNFVAHSNQVECIKAVLSLFPESERLHALNHHNKEEISPLDLMNEETRNAIMEWLPKPESSGKKRSRDGAMRTDFGQPETKVVRLGCSCWDQIMAGPQSDSSGFIYSG